VSTSLFPTLYIVLKLLRGCFLLCFSWISFPLRPFQKELVIPLSYEAYRRVHISSFFPSLICLSFQLAQDRLRPPAFLLSSHRRDDFIPLLSGLHELSPPPRLQTPLIAFSPPPLPSTPPPPKKLSFFFFHPFREPAVCSPLRSGSPLHPFTFLRGNSLAKNEEKESFFPLTFHKPMPSHLHKKINPLVDFTPRFRRSSPSPRLRVKSYS